MTNCCIIARIKWKTRSANRRIDGASSPLYSWDSGPTPIGTGVSEEDSMRMLAYAVVGGYLAALAVAGNHAQATGLSQTTSVRRATAQEPDSSRSSSSPRPLL